MKLYDLPRTTDGIKIYGLQIADKEDAEVKDVVIRFGHIDGMYSYCWVDGDPGTTLHLGASTPIKPYKDGYKVVE